MSDSGNVLQPPAKRRRQRPRRLADSDEHVELSPQQARPTVSEKDAVAATLQEMLQAGIISRQTANQVQPALVALAIALHANEDLGNNQQALDLFQLGSTSRHKTDWLPRLRRLDDYRASKFFPDEDALNSDEGLRFAFAIFLVVPDVVPTVAAAWLRVSAAFHESEPGMRDARAVDQGAAGTSINVAREHGLISDS